MPAEQIQLLGEVADLLSGGTPSKSTPEFWGGDIPWLTPKDMGNWTGGTEETVSNSAIGSGTRLAPPEASFIAVRGMSLHNEIRIVRARKAIAFNQDIKAVVPRAGIHPDYLFQVLVSKKTKLLGLVESAGHGTGRLPTDQLLALEIARFDQKTEMAIAELICALDQKIELNRQMNRTLKAMAQAIFKSWFIDFNPVRAKMEGQKPYLSQEIWSLFPDHLSEDGSPSGWSHKPLTHFFEIVGGGTPKTSEVSYWGGDVPWFSVVDTPSGADTYVIDTEKTITAEGLQNSSAQLIEAGATIVSARGTVGNLARTGRAMAFNQSCYGLRGANGYGPSFVFLTASHMASKLQSLAHGSVFSTITRQTFEAISLFAPSSELAEQFEIASSPLFDRMLANVQESRTLSAIRDLLLPKLMSGEICLKDAEKLVGKAGA
ncbi:restriction endonuclease subunit S [Mesorhizobium sp. 1B3]|uniref:restriction endonuclease subunit S n=1 Tax=Mesorhizobium sp. 1B3 TaxID=3243599 RepID=UPI003D99548C